ncbi:uncharacterized protein LOC126743361 isoform X3 [Anthonomus grandis grandis]|uniref:uncharacterized protein LOC126743361 isoform X3 n=1 Tax=Anthonomus grandis grandis TaxID=2921223 RepID=UPI00216525F2|nr:uncharacterized protein LOC126743361 isoform X3 [Anthonomus grandis grandis]
MSWAQRRVPAGGPPSANVPPVQMYNPVQHSNTAEWQTSATQPWHQPPQQQVVTPDLIQQQQQQQHQPYWQQQPGQAYPAPSHTPNANSVGQYQQYQDPHNQQQQPAFYQNVPPSGYNTQQAYGNVQYSQQFDQNNTYNSQQQPLPQQHSATTDAWGEWGGWGDDDNSNAQSMVSQQAQAVTNPIGESFSKDESWNWSVSDSHRQQNVLDTNSAAVPPPQNNLFPTIGDLKNAKSDNLGLSNAHRKKLETPQWSTESQLSLESSDDVRTSESDKSHMISRSSTISHSPIFGQDPLVPSQSHHEENLTTNSNTNLQVENREIVRHEAPTPQAVHPLPPPPINTQTPPLLPPPQGGTDDSRNPYIRSSGITHKSASKFKPIGLVNATDNRPPLMPPSTFNQSVNLETLPDNSEHPDHPVVSGVPKVSPSSQQQWPTADNNEAPINDRNQYLETGHLSVTNLSEGNEAPTDPANDTLPPPGLQRMVPGQLEQSESGVGRTDQPIPGFSRMVLGRNENSLDLSGQNASQFDLSGPPEGLHRMVPGESSPPEMLTLQGNIENDSEPELNQIIQGVGVLPPTRSATIGADTPPPLAAQPEPPAIATPPRMSPTIMLSNRSETIGSDLAASLGSDQTDPTQSIPVTSLEPTQNSKRSKSKDKIEQPDNRRDRKAIEGRTTEQSISNITNAVRNLTVGENLTDSHTSNTSLPEQSPRRSSRQESTDSDSDRKKSSRSLRDKRPEKSKSRDKERDRYKERESERDRYRDRNSERYSPDPYREKRERDVGRGKNYRERRYEEDTDYYSDKERDKDRRHDDRSRDYERNYNSLRKDKDKRRKSRDPRDYRERDSRRGDYHYSRYGDDYGSENRPSRPSSRSESMHNESYRERRHERHDIEHRERRKGEWEGDKDRTRYRNRERRDQYNPYQSFAYDPYNPYYQQYQYYENLRRTNPQAYAEWYRKYYQQATTASNASFAGEDRASVHSGRSSANDELAKDRYTRQSFYSQSNYYGQSNSVSGHYGLDTSSIGYNRHLDQTDNSIYEEQKAARLTPAKFATAHMAATIASGKLVKILPHYPMDGQNATVEISTMQSMLENDPNFIELSSFPGPLVKGITHKKQIIEYCEGKIKGAAFNREIYDVDSYVLMWELLILLIRQNGMVVGTDIAELLLVNNTNQPVARPASALSASSSIVEEKNEVSESSNQPVSEHGSTISILKEEEVTKRFREHLLYGSCQEALDWAMRHGLWGHALFLASKLDKRTHANVMMRFANGLTMNDPLQTLYQLLSGKMPAAVTCVSDEKWGDWSPHLAMILSNSTQRPDLNRKAITQMGDTLLNRGNLYAAQFCYLMANVGFGKHTDSTAKLVLLGSDHRKTFPQFVTNESVHMTEIYEFACGLNEPEFHISEFQFYKYILATRLADFGLLQRSLQYLELLASGIIRNLTVFSGPVLESICELSDKLKFYDPVGDVEDESEFGAALETSRPDKSWLKSLKDFQNDQAGVLNYPVNQDLHTTIGTDHTLQQSYVQDDVWQQEQELYDQNQRQQFEQSQYENPQVWSVQDQSAQQFPEPILNNTHQYQEPQSQNYWHDQQQMTWNDQNNQYNQSKESNREEQTVNYYDNSSSQNEDHSNVQPQISMPGQKIGNSAFNDEPLAHEKLQEKPNAAATPKVQSPKKKEDNQSTGWFGGIFSKLSMRPKNQMKLPDDKNPKIVWDEDKKRWVNVDEGSTDPVSELKPPPKLSDLMPKVPVPQSGMGVLESNLHDSSNLSYGSVNFNTNMGVTNTPFNVDPSQMTATGPMSLPIMGSNMQREESMMQKQLQQSNMFKMQKNRNVKNAYVDVFKQNGVKANTDGVPVPEKVPLAAPSQMNFFIPQAVPNPDAPLDFLTPGGAPVHIGEPQIRSRWSSTSSLSREVASYMTKSGPIG